MARIYAVLFSLLREDMIAIHAMTSNNIATTHVFIMNSVRYIASYYIAKAVPNIVSLISNLCSSDNGIVSNAAVTYHSTSSCLASLGANHLAVI